MSSHNNFLHGADRFFATNITNVNKYRTDLSGYIGVLNKNERSDESSGMSSVADVCRGILHVPEVEFHAKSKKENVLVLGDTAFSQFWISETLAT